MKQTSFARSSTQTDRWGGPPRLERRAPDIHYQGSGPKRLSRSPGSQQGAPFRRGEPTELTINRQEVVLVDASIEQQASSAGHQQRIDPRPVGQEPITWTQYECPEPIRVAAPGFRSPALRAFADAAQGGRGGIGFDCRAEQLDQGPTEILDCWPGRPLDSEDPPQLHHGNELAAAQHHRPKLPGCDASIHGLSAQAEETSGLGDRNGEGLHAHAPLARVSLFSCKDMGLSCANRFRARSFVVLDMELAYRAPSKVHGLSFGARRGMSLVPGPVSTPLNWGIPPMTTMSYGSDPLAVATTSLALLSPGPILGRRRPQVAALPGWRL